MFLMIIRQLLPLRLYILLFPCLCRSFDALSGGQDHAGLRPSHPANWLL